MRSTSLPPTLSKYQGTDDHGALSETSSAQFSADRSKKCWHDLLLWLLFHLWDMSIDQKDIPLGSQANGGSHQSHEMIVTT